MVVGGCRSLVAEHWRLKPEALGSIPDGTTFLSFPLPFQRSMDSNGPDYLYRSSDLGEPHLLGSKCCDKSSRFFRNHKHTQQLSRSTGRSGEPVESGDQTISALAEHAWSHHHPVDWDKVRVLEQQPHLYHRLTLE